VPVAEKVILRHRYIFLAGETMKAARFILITGLVIATVLALLVFTGVWPGQTGQNSKVKSNVFVANVPDNNHTDDVSIMLKEHLGNNSSETLSSHPDTPPADIAVAHASKDMSPSKGLPVAQDKPNLNLPVGQRAEALSAFQDKPDLPVSQGQQSIASVGAADETKLDSMISNPVGIGGSYFNNPEVYGQNGELLPSPEKVLASKAKSILQNHKDRNAEGVIISEEVVGDDSTSGGQSLNDGVGPASADMTGPAAVVTGTGTTVESLAEQSTSDTDNPADTKAQTDRLLAALAEGNPVDVRLEAIYLLADVAPDQAKKFLNDKEDVIRCEAERIAGIIPHD
jgi:hypothetical protein